MLWRLRRSQSRVTYECLSLNADLSFLSRLTFIVTWIAVLLGVAGAIYYGVLANVIAVPARSVMEIQTKKEIDAETHRLKAEYGELFDAVAETLFRHDPIGINFEDNTDEYYPETRTILPRLKTCVSAQDVATIVHEEFQRWFDHGIAGPRERYTDIADEIWNLWRNSPVSGAK